MRRNSPQTLIRLALIVALLWPAPVKGAYEDVGVGARVTGMGNVFTGVADDVYSIYYNPAGLATLTRPELATSYSKLFTGLSDGSNLQNSFLAYTRPIREGRHGAWGIAWNYLTLDGLYHETTLYGSYAQALFAESQPNKIYGGLSFKYLNRSLGGTAVANSALGSTGIATGIQDPVLKNNSKTNVDLDLGLLYRLQPRWTLGLMVSHLLEPNIAFSSGDTDKLGRNYKLGASYKAPFSTLAGDLAFRKAPDGSTDKIVSLGAEKWLPTLMHGSFGIRGALGLGSRDFRQFTAGLSYKIYRMQLDYGFAVPLGGISGTSGSHRMGITFRFGRSRYAEPAFREAMLESIQELGQVGTPEFSYHSEELAVLKRTAIEEFLRQAHLDVGAGRFADAMDKIGEALSFKPGDPKMSASQDRLKTVATFYPSVTEFKTDPVQAALYQGAVLYLMGKNQEALKKLSYATSLNPIDEKIELLAQAIKSKSGVTPQAAPPTSAAPPPTPTVPPPPPTAPTPKAPPPPTPAETKVSGVIALMEIAIRNGEYDKVLELATRVIELEPTNAVAYKRMGEAYSKLEKYSEALRALRLAYEYEKDSAEAGKALRAYLGAMNAQMERLTKTQAAPKAVPKEVAKTPQEIERLYESGVDLYAQGKFSEAADVFRKILKYEPGNASARLALDRVQTDILSGAKKKLGVPP